MKTVFIVLPSLGDGGGERLAVDIASRLDKSIFNIKLISLYGKMQSINTSLAIKNNLDIIYLDKKIGFDFSIFKKIRKIFKKYKPDIIHSHTDVLLYLLPFYKKKQIKLHTIHSVAEKEAVGYQKLVRKIAFKNKKVIPVGICDTVTDTIARYYKMSKDKIPTIYNGINTKKYSFENRKRNDVFTWINVGTLYEVKNQIYLIDLFEKFQKKVPNSKLLILGDGPMKNEIKNYIDSKHLNDKIIMVGKVENVNDYLKIADVYVISSKYEGMPLSMIEAMSSGLPIVSTNVGGIRDVIKNAENGYLFELQNDNDALEAFEKLYYDILLWELISKNNIEKSKKYDYELMANAYTRLYLGEEAINNEGTEL